MWSIWGGCIETLLCLTHIHDVFCVTYGDLAKLGLVCDPLRRWDSSVHVRDMKRALPRCVGFVSKRSLQIETELQNRNQACALLTNMVWCTIAPLSKGKVLVLPNGIERTQALGGTLEVGNPRCLLVHLSHLAPMNRQHPAPVAMDAAMNTGIHPLPAAAEWILSVGSRILQARGHR